MTHGTHLHSFKSADFPMEFRRNAVSEKPLCCATFTVYVSSTIEERKCGQRAVLGNLLFS